MLRKFVVIQFVCYFSTYCFLLWENSKYSSEYRESILYSVISEFDKIKSEIARNILVI